MGNPICGCAIAPRRSGRGRRAGPKVSDACRTVLHDRAPQNPVWTIQKPGEIRTRFLNEHGFRGPRVVPKPSAGSEAPGPRPAEARHGDQAETPCPSRKRVRFARGSPRAVGKIRGARPTWAWPRRPGPAGLCALLAALGVKANFFGSAFENLWPTPAPPSPGPLAANSDRGRGPGLRRTPAACASVGSVAGRPSGSGVSGRLPPSGLMAAGPREHGPGAPQAAGYQYYPYCLPQYVGLALRQRGRWPARPCGISSRPAVDWGGPSTTRAAPCCDVLPRGETRPPIPAAIRVIGCRLWRRCRLAFQEPAGSRPPRPLPFRPAHGRSVAPAVCSGLFAELTSNELKPAHGRSVAPAIYCGLFAELTRNELKPAHGLSVALAASRRHLQGQYRAPALTGRSAVSVCRLRRRR